MPHEIDLMSFATDLEEMQRHLEFALVGDY